MNEAVQRCERCQSLLEAEDLRCPICSHATPRVARADSPTAQVEILRCSGCGAAMSYEVTARASACAFCGSTIEVEVPDDPTEETERFVPFSIDHAAAERAFRNWLGGLGWFRPSNLRSVSTLESLQPLWWVGWVADAVAKVSWTVDSDAGRRRADWAPHAGQTDLEFEDLVVSASRGLSSTETEALFPSYDLDSAAELPTRAGGRATIERFDLPRSAARQQVLAMIGRVVEQRLEAGHLPGKRFRNLNTELVLRRLTSRRYAFPCYVLAYRYRGRLYRLVISGQDAGCLLGTAPYSKGKIIAAVLGGLLGLWLVAGGLFAMLAS
jgi:hypothetical protein